MRRFGPLIAAILLPISSQAVAGTPTPLLDGKARTLARIGAAWQGHPDAEMIRAAVRAGGELNFLRNPFRLAGEVKREGAELVIRIDTLAAREHVHGWGPFTVVRLNRKAKQHGTLGKTIAGITGAIADLAAADRTLRGVRILAPSVVNSDLSMTLRRLGFVDSHPSARSIGRGRQLVLGRHQALELEIALPPGQLDR